MATVDPMPNAPLEPPSLMYRFKRALLRFFCIKFEDDRNMETPYHRIQHV